MNLEGKVAFVTGGSGGLGRFHSLSLTRADCNIGVASRDKEVRGGGGLFTF